MRCISKLLETVADAALRRPRAVQARHVQRSGPVRPLDAGGVVAARLPLPTTSRCARLRVLSSPHAPPGRLPHSRRRARRRHRAVTCVRELPRSPNRHTESFGHCSPATPPSFRRNPHGTRCSRSRHSKRLRTVLTRGPFVRRSRHAGITRWDRFGAGNGRRGRCLRIWSRRIGHEVEHRHRHAANKE